MESVTRKGEMTANKFSTCAHILKLDLLAMEWFDGLSWQCRQRNTGAINDVNFQDANGQGCNRTSKPRQHLQRH